MAAATQFSFIVCLLAAMASMGKVQATTTTAANTTAANTTAATGGSTAAPATGGSTASPGSTATPGTGPTTTAGTGGSTAAPGSNAPATAAATTQPPMVACLSCNGTGASNDPCPDASSSFATTIDCATQGGCWVYREEDTSNSGGNFTISRGCGRSDMNLNDVACTSQKESEHCNEANNIKVCRRCCTTARCNNVVLVLTGSMGTPTAYVSTVVIVTSFIMAVFSNDLRF